ncbi:MAG: transposase [Pyrinomonadaceae bacterium]|nr:transposase [Pyrinomonadaceae bacterium]
MSTREQKGLEIANKAKITRRGHLWLVPSTTAGKKYAVDLEAETPRCTCPDHEFRRAACKHIHAVQIILQRTQTTETKDGETTVTETVTVQKRITYKQEWPSYNKSQTREKSEFLALLYALCQSIEEPVQTVGRPRLPLADIIFAAVFRTYSTLSGRRFTSDLRDALAKGYLSKMPSYNSIFDYLKMESITPYLKHLITESSMPLKSVETNFAVDSSGFGAPQVKWHDVKYGQDSDREQWIKLHLMCGTSTHIVTSVEVSDGYQHDYPFYKPLVDKTAQSGFKMAEVSADKGYIGDSNLLATVRHGAVPYIPFKSNATEQSKVNPKSSVWVKMYHYYNLRRDEFLEHYHRRSNVETVFSMIKAKFGQRLKCKTPTAQVNEALCKVLAHNLCCVIKSVYELNINASFRTENASVRKAS